MLGASNFLTPEGGFKKVERKRVGIMGMKAPARAHTEIFDADGTTKIGGKEGREDDERDTYFD